MRVPTVWKAEEFSGYEGPLLLDTHIWVWYLEGEEGTTAPGLMPLLEQIGGLGGLYVLDVSFWEVAVKSAKGKLTLSMEPTIWLGRAEKASGIRFLPLDREIMLLSTRLPGNPHNDPADRMLIAAAQLKGVPLVTADKLIIEYAEEHKGTPLLDARP